MDNPCWLLGSAPSINEFDLSPLASRPTFAYNRSYVAWEEWGFAPAHWCLIDWNVLNSMNDDLPELTASYPDTFFHIGIPEARWEEGRRLIQVQAPNMALYPLRDGWGMDPLQMYYCGDVAAFSLQVAYRQGHRTAYALGIDLLWPEREAETDALGARRGLSEDSEHFHPNYYPPGYVHSEVHEDAHLRSWMKSVIDATANNLQVISCGPASRLNEFVPYMDFEDSLING